MRLIFSFMMLFSLTACFTQPHYKQQKFGAPAQQPLAADDVNFILNDTLYVHAPQCVFILPQHTDSADPHVTQAVDRALARHAGEKIKQVIFPRYVSQMLKKTALDPRHAPDLQRLAQQLNCPYSLETHIYEQGDDYVGIAAQKYIGLRVILRAAQTNDAPLWQATHTVWRGEGTIPLSPFAVLSGAASATLFDHDPDILPDLIDRAMRRLMRSLPPFS